MAFVCQKRDCTSWTKASTMACSTSRSKRSDALYTSDSYTVICDEAGHASVMLLETMPLLHNTTYLQFCHLIHVATCGVPLDSDVTSLPMITC